MEFRAMMNHSAREVFFDNVEVPACVQTQGGYAFAEEYDLEGKFRETWLYQVAPISTNLILSYLSEHVLGMPRSY